MLWTSQSIHWTYKEVSHSFVRIFSKKNIYGDQKKLSFEFLRKVKNRSQKSESRMQQSE